MNYTCSACFSTYPITTSKWKCDCGGLFRFAYEKKTIDFNKTATSRNHSIWKYIDALPFEKEDIWQEITMGEGGTPLIKVADNTYAKAEYFMPTLSFKDRGAAVLVSMAKKKGVNRIVADSSGNAGTSIAAYGARAGIQCEIFVPESTSNKKIKQIEAHGAVIHKVPGTREDTAEAAIEMVETTGAFYASHIYNPIFYEGTKTYVYELFEQMDGNLPDALVIPVGNGTLLMGVYVGVKDLLASGHIKKMPKLLGVQAAACAPIVKAFEEGSDTVTPVVGSETLAEGIASAAPARGTEILQAIKELDGDIIGVSEESILAARQELASKGMYVEITSASVYAGYLQYVEKYPELKGKSIVFPLSGAGIKSD